MQVIQVSQLESIPFSEGTQKAYTSSLAGYASLQVLLHGLLGLKGSVNMLCHHVQSGGVLQLYTSS